MDSQAILRLLAQRVWTIFFFLAFGGFAAFLLGLFLVTYESNGQMIIRPVGSASKASSEWLNIGMVYSPHQENITNLGVTYLSIVKSRKVIENVVDELNLQKRYEDTSPILDIVKQPLRFLYYGRLPAIELSPRDQAIKSLRESVSAVLLTGSSLLSVSVAHDNAQKSSEIVNSLMASTIDASIEKNRLEADRLLEMLSMRLESARKDRLDVYKALSALRRSSGFSASESLDDRIVKVLDKIKRFDQLIEQGKESLLLSRSRLDVIQEKVKELPEFKVFEKSIDANPQLLSLKQRLLQQRIELFNTELDYQPQSTQIKSQQQEIRLTEEAIREEISAAVPASVMRLEPNRDRFVNELFNAQLDREILPREIEMLQEQIDLLSDEFVKLNTVHEDLRRLERQLNDVEGEENDVLTMMKDLKTLRDVDFSEFEVLNHAVTPRYPSINDIPLFLYVLFGALAAGLISTMYVLSVPPEKRVFDPIGPLVQRRIVPLLRAGRSDTGQAERPE